MKELGFIDLSTCTGVEADDSFDKPNCFRCMWWCGGGVVVVVVVVVVLVAVAVVWWW